MTQRDTSTDTISTDKSPARGRDLNILNFHHKSHILLISERLIDIYFP
jgi:hypothetical protein